MCVWLWPRVHKGETAVTSLKPHGLILTRTSWRVPACVWLLISFPALIASVCIHPHLSENGSSPSQTWQLSAGGYERNQSELLLIVSTDEMHVDIENTTFTWEPSNLNWGGFKLMASRLSVYVKNNWNGHISSYPVRQFFGSPSEGPQPFLPIKTLFENRSLLFFLKQERKKIKSQKEDAKRRGIDMQWAGERRKAQCDVMAHFAAALRRRSPGATVWSSSSSFIFLFPYWWQKPLTVKLKCENVLSAHKRSVPNCVRLCVCVPVWLAANVGWRLYEPAGSLLGNLNILQA